MQNAPKKESNNSNIMPCFSIISYELLCCCSAQQLFVNIAPIKMRQKVLMTERKVQAHLYASCLVTKSNEDTVGFDFVVNTVFPFVGADALRM